MKCPRLGRTALQFVVISTLAGASTRFSSLHLVPHADLLRGGDVVVDLHGVYFNDASGEPSVGPAFLAHFSFIEWVNLHVGYAGGTTLGFKARILGEQQPWMPSLAVGGHNFISHKEVYYFGIEEKDREIRNEIYLALGKGIDQLKTKIHLGMQSIPGEEREVVNPFFGVEKYYGRGLYSSVEVHRRHEEFVPSLFVSWRTLKKRLEISAGLVALHRILFDENGEFGFGLQSHGDTTFAKPALWFGLRYHGSLGFGKKGGFETVEDRLRRQEAMIAKLQMRVDELGRRLAGGTSRVEKLDSRLSAMSDSLPGNREHVKALVLDRLIALKSLYDSDPFEPEKVKQLVGEIVNYRDRALPALQGILLDREEDRRIRMLAAGILGEIGSGGASDVLIDVLSKDEDPRIKIEVLIALGKIRETEAMYLMEQLANSPNDAVALTAQEVLGKLERETGVKVSRDLRMRRISTEEEPESVIGDDVVPGTEEPVDEGAGTPETAAPGGDTGEGQPASTEQAEAELDRQTPAPPTEESTEESSETSREQTVQDAAPPAETAQSAQPAETAETEAVESPEQQPPEEETAKPAEGNEAPADQPDEQW